MANKLVFSCAEKDMAIIHKNIPSFLEKRQGTDGLKAKKGAITDKQFNQWLQTLSDAGVDISKINATIEEERMLASVTRMFQRNKPQDDSASNLAKFNQAKKLSIETITAMTNSKNETRRSVTSPINPAVAPATAAPSSNASPSRKEPEGTQNNESALAEKKTAELAAKVEAAIHDAITARLASRHANEEADTQTALAKAVHEMVSKKKLSIDQNRQKIDKNEAEIKEIEIQIKNTIDKFIKLDTPDHLIARLNKEQQALENAELKLAEEKEYKSKASTAVRDLWYSVTNPEKTSARRIQAATQDVTKKKEEIQRIKTEINQIETETASQIKNLDTNIRQFDHEINTKTSANLALQATIKELTTQLEDLSAQTTRLDKLANETNATAQQKSTAADETFQRAIELNPDDNTIRVKIERGINQAIQAIREAKEREKTIIADDTSRKSAKTAEPTVAVQKVVSQKPSVKTANAESPVPKPGRLNPSALGLKIPGLNAQVVKTPENLNNPPPPEAIPVMELTFQQKKARLSGILKGSPKENNDIKLAKPTVNQREPIQTLAAKKSVLEKNPDHDLPEIKKLFRYLKVAAPQGSPLKQISINIVGDEEKNIFDSENFLNEANKLVQEIYQNIRNSDVQPAVQLYELLQKYHVDDKQTPTLTADTSSSNLDSAATPDVEPNLNASTGSTMVSYASEKMTEVKLFKTKFESEFKDFLDEKFKHEAAACNIIFMSSIPDEKNLTDLDTGSNQAYVRIKNKSPPIDTIFYINKKMGYCKEVTPHEDERLSDKERQKQHELKQEVLENFDWEINDKVKDSSGRITLSSTEVAEQIVPITKFITPDNQHFQIKVNKEIPVDKLATWLDDFKKTTRSFSFDLEKITQNLRIDENQPNRMFPLAEAIDLTKGIKTVEIKIPSKKQPTTNAELETNQKNGPSSPLTLAQELEAKLNKRNKAAEKGKPISIEDRVKANQMETKAQKEKTSRDPALTAILAANRIKIAGEDKDGVVDDDDDDDFGPKKASTAKAQPVGTETEKKHSNPQTTAHSASPINTSVDHMKQTPIGNRKNFLDSIKKGQTLKNTSSESNADKRNSSPPPLFANADHILNKATISKLKSKNIDTVSIYIGTIDGAKNKFNNPTPGKIYAVWDETKGVLTDLKYDETKQTWAERGILNRENDEFEVAALENYINENPQKNMGSTLSIDSASYNDILGDHTYTANHTH